MTGFLFYNRLHLLQPASSSTTGFIFDNRLPRNLIFSYGNCRQLHLNWTHFCISSTFVVLLYRLTSLTGDDQPAGYHPTSVSTIVHNRFSSSRIPGRAAVISNSSSVQAVGILLPTDNSRGYQGSAIAREHPSQSSSSLQFKMVINQMTGAL